MREKFGFLICLWILLWGNCLGRFEAENSLKLTSPESLKGVYECSIISNFGFPQYGETLVGTVIYPKANQRACWDFDDFEIFFRSRQGGLPTYLLVDSGGCFFTLKALYAQKAGAAALLVTDNWNEPLIALDSPGEEYYARAEYLEEITIPSARITKSLGDSIKKALTRGEVVTMNLEWRESPGHHDHERVKYEFWTHREYGCGPSCDSNIEFVKKFKGTAQILEQKGYTKFTPHYMAWHSCEVVFSRRQCKSMCINHGRYCAMNPPEVFSKEYYGKDVVVQKLRQACLFKVANERGKSWLWWDYVMHFGTHCRMEEHKYTKECADEVIQSLGVDLNEVDKCIGDTEADVENPLLEAENDAWIDKQSSGGIRLIGPSTLVINNREYRGKLDKEAVLKAICESFQKTADQANCLSEGLGSYEVDLKEQKATVKSSVQPKAVLQTVSKTGQKTAPSEKQELQLNLWQSLRKLLPLINPFPVYSQD